jgi:hypothetical protein
MVLEVTGTVNRNSTDSGFILFPSLRIRRAIGAAGEIVASSQSYEAVMEPGEAAAHRLVGRRSANSGQEAF